MKQLIILPALATFVACAWAQVPESTERAVSSITPNDVIMRISIIADDSMGGRNTPSPGLEKTAQYIAAEFRRLGLEPGGDEGDFIQRYGLENVALDPTNSTIAFAGGPTLSFGDDAVFTFGRLGDETTTGSIVLLKGVTSDPNELTALPLPNSTVVYLAGTLDAATRATIFGIFRQRPAATLVVGQYPDDYWEFVNQQPPPGRLVVPGMPVSGRAVILIRERAVEGFFDGRKIDWRRVGEGDGAIEYSALTDVEVTIHLARTLVSQSSAPNVVGILEGSDPRLRDEFVLFSAHMDHIGTAGAPLASCESLDGDLICNGADDDASGTAAVLEAAEAFSLLEPRPRRSMIFLTVSGEEKGLLGSAYFAAHPSVPISQIVANLNSDMVGRNWRDTIAVIGKEHSDLGSTLDAIADAHTELAMTPINDRWPSERFYFRSDHYNFAKRGVPILFFFNGTHDDYHKPSDEVAKIDGEKEARLVKLLFYLGLEVANADARPKWNPDSFAQIVDAALFDTY